MEKLEFPINGTVARVEDDEDGVLHVLAGRELTRDEMMTVLSAWDALDMLEDDLELM